MDRKHSLPLFVLIAALTFLPLAVLAKADVPARGAGGGGILIDRPRAQPDTAMGALASIGCGFFVRASIATAGTQVGTIVGAVACCGFMLFDAFVLEAR
jgi:hypothetical protein